MGLSILFGLVTNLLYDLLKLPVSKLLRQTSMQKAISETAALFDDIEGIPDHLENWVKKDETRKAILDFLAGHPEQIDADELIDLLVEKVGFY